MCRWKVQLLCILLSGGAGEAGGWPLRTRTHLGENYLLLLTLSIHFSYQEKLYYPAKLNTASPLPSLATHWPGEKVGDDGFIVFSVPARWTQGLAL